MSEELIKTLKLKPHKDGGFFRETFRSQHKVRTSSGERSIATSIYYYITSDDFTSWHRLESDEIWNYYLGSSVTLYILSEEKGLICKRLGSPLENPNYEPQVLIPAKHWFAAETDCESSYTLMGCAVFPGFEYEDFSVAKREELKKKFPQHRELIERLTRA